MKKRRLLYLIAISILLAIYYLIVGINMYHAGYHNHEALFYVEKARIIFEGAGDRLKVIGLTSPIFPFYGVLPIVGAKFSYALAPIFASAIGTALLFLIIGLCVIRTTNENFFVLLLIILFTLHPGILYTACSGKGIYLSLIFFFLFFYNIFRFYYSNTTFHISIASIIFVILIFCDYRFIWITLFFIPLIISIAIQSLNLGEKQSIFRLFLSFNSPSLRRKLVNKTFAMYVIIFILPIISIFCYKVLNQTHANDFNYFNDNPYASWVVLVDKLECSITPVIDNYKIPEVSFLTSVRMLVFCPLIILAAYFFRSNTQHLLTILIPFGLVEFFKIKYDNTFLPMQYYLIFLVISFLTLVFKGHLISRHVGYKVLISVLVGVQIYTGYYFLKNSFIESEKNFLTFNRNSNGSSDAYDEYKDVASYINHLPRNSQVLVDDANAYPIVAFVKDMQAITLPYQSSFLSAIENPNKYVDYVLITTFENPVGGFTQLNYKYKDIMEKKNDIRLYPVFESDNWIVYKITTARNASSDYLDY
ncbi:hypothetical protein BDD43_0138 [Mucilaginibacter gracilis]|uniref:Dolichyl-phosphate-mannose-protein mannosyltransferase n=1 Tax=Mucilaginibacter gracilis TaxID=423350 RepID=A0A495IW14_9SPHI|nr:hypothetical protein [Mucilaginibacter gracilis]RKR80049.1 hypothetical protein BDD43_0138 [Mucilaginibacter gracilis]